MAKISKILYIITQSEGGGAQRYVFDLATNLSPENFTVSVAAGGNGVLFEKLAEKNINLFKISSLVRPISPLADIKCIFELIKLIKREKPDVIHLNSSKASIVGSLASAWCKKSVTHKLVYTVHGFVFNEPLPALLKFFYFWVEKIAALPKDKLICIYQNEMSNAIKQKIVPADKLITINNGIGRIDYLDQAAARQNLNLPADKCIIGTVANFYTTKGLIYFIEAAKSVINNFPDIRFIIIGDGMLRKEFETKISELGLQDIFSLAGSKPEAAKYLKAFDIFVLPSLKEGLSYSLLEAMQAGLPIISTRVGGTPEIINHGRNGLLVEPADAGQLAKNISDLLINKKLAQQLAGQAKSDSQGKFTLEKMVAETIKIYQE